MEAVVKTKRTLTPEQQQRRAERARLRKSLVYEMWSGKPVYCAGYQDVLDGRKTVEQVMPSLADLAGQGETNCAWVAPEVDTKADTSSAASGFDYYVKKITQLLDFGVEKVIWLFTKARKVWIAEPRKDWIIRDWSQPVPVLADCQFVPDELMPPKK